MESTIVIKVKCGDTLRRFNTFIAENGKLGMNVQQLRDKMRSLFNLNVDDDFSIIYTDSDGDSVTLVEDCDLDDVVLQGLNPVRMVLILNTVGKNGSSNVRSSSRQFASEDSLRIHQSIENVKTSVEKVVEAVPELLQGVLLKLTRDLVATVSDPVVADIIHSASKIGQSFAQESSAETKISDSETNSGLPGSKSSTDDEGKAEEIDSGVCRVPDLNHAPPLTSGFVATVASPKTCSNKDEKRDTHCPMFADGGSLNADIKQYNECPFLKKKAVLRPYTSYKGDRRSQSKRNHSHSERVQPVSHTGVQCDVCGVLPISGPRFKSKVIHDYDLCNSCYQKNGYEADYVRIDSPMLYHHIMKAMQHKHEGNGPKFQGYGPFKPVAGSYVPFTVNPIPQVNQLKLDSCFISDVTVMDGTTMAPLTPFTKVWRMQNNGNVVWPAGTQLVWTGGDKFSNALLVDLEIPAIGVPVEGEIDIDVDFVAPRLPGEYVSHWRLSSPSGQKFGQKVWVAIQVDASTDSLSGSFNHLNLNEPPQNIGHDNPVVIDVDVGPLMNNICSPSNLCPAEVPVTTGTVSPKVVLQSTTVTPLVIEPISEALTRKGTMKDKDQNQESQGVASETMGSVRNEQDLNFPINGFLLVGDGATASPTVRSVSYPVVDSSKIEAGTKPVSASSSVENLESLAQSEVFSETEELLLKQLSEMGFGQVDLNKEILKKNGYEMEKTVLDLWDISEWDPILGELEEMGFSDKTKNAILLVKNKGSIKRVVMDLISGDQSE